MRGQLKIDSLCAAEIAKCPSHGPRSFILCAACRTIKSTPRFTKLRTSPGTAWFMQGNSRKHTRNACGLQCIPVCIELRLPPSAPDQISSVIVAGPARSHAHNLSTRRTNRSANLGPDRPTCENQAADIPRSREFSNNRGIKKRFFYVHRWTVLYRAPPNARSPLRQTETLLPRGQKIKFNHWSLTDANCIISMHNISGLRPRKKFQSVPPIRRCTP